MRVESKQILRFDFDRTMRRRTELVDQLHELSKEMSRIECEIEHCDYEIQEISNKFDQLVGQEEIGASVHPIR